MNPEHVVSTAQIEPHWMVSKNLFLLYPLLYDLKHHCSVFPILKHHCFVISCSFVVSLLNCRNLCFCCHRFVESNCFLSTAENNNIDCFGKLPDVSKYEVSNNIRLLSAKYFSFLTTFDRISNGRFVFCDKICHNSGGYRRP